MNNPYKKIFFYTVLALYHCSIQSAQFHKIAVAIRNLGGNLRTIASQSTQNTKLKNGVYPYHPDHMDKITHIARDRITSIVNCIGMQTPKDRDHLLKTNVIPAFERSDIISKVYLKDGKPVGFINYAIYQPWHRLILANEIGPNAEIYHLAVDKNHKKIGYGTALISAAIADCKEKSTNRISLWTSIADNLMTYYPKFGFKLIRTTKLHEHQYELRLKPHPARIMMERIRSLMKNH